MLNQGQTDARERCERQVERIFGALALKSYVHDARNGPRSRTARE